MVRLLLPHRHTARTEAAMKVPLLAGIASGLMFGSGTTSAWGDCRQVRVDGVSHQVCDNSPTVVYPQNYGQGGYGGGAFQQGAAEGAADLLRLQMLLNALPPSPPPALPPGGARSEERRVGKAGNKR